MVGSLKRKTARIIFIARGRPQSSKQPIREPPLVIGSLKGKTAWAGDDQAVTCVGPLLSDEGRDEGDPIGGRPHYTFT